MVGIFGGLSPSINRKVQDAAPFPSMLVIFEKKEEESAV